MNTAKTDPRALYNIGYGLYVVTSNDGEKDNGLIVNSVMQLTSSPEQLAVCINKQNYSHDTIRSKGKMNVNCLSVSTPFKVFEAFGFKSGRDTSKFEDCTPRRSENGLAVLPRYINAYMSLEVNSYVDLGTHGMFICTLTESAVVSEEETMSYAYYHKNVKPKPDEKKESGSYICTVCGYVHDEKPDADFVCPICKHDASVFEPIK